MDVTEVAHWRYRVKALLRDIEQTRKTLRDCNDPYDIFPEDFLTEARQNISAQLTLEEWLLEEARYKVELGEIAVPPVPRLEAGTTGTTAEEKAMSDNPWANLPRAIEMLSWHKTGPYPFHCEHDELFVMSDPEKYSPEELAELDELGFIPNEYEGFSSYRYGSA